MYTEIAAHELSRWSVDSAHKKLLQNNLIYTLFLGQKTRNTSYKQKSVREFACVEARKIARVNLRAKLENYKI